MESAPVTAPSYLKCHPATETGGWKITRSNTALLLVLSIYANALRQLINYKSKSILWTINECSFGQVKAPC